MTRLCGPWISTAAGPLAAPAPSQAPPDAKPPAPTASARSSPPSTASSGARPDAQALLTRRAVLQHRIAQAHITRAWNSLRHAQGPRRGTLMAAVACRTLRAKRLMLSLACARRAAGAPQGPAPGAAPSITSAAPRPASPAGVSHADALRSARSRLTAFGQQLERLCGRQTPHRVAPSDLGTAAVAPAAQPVSGPGGRGFAEAGETAGAGTARPVRRPLWHFPEFAGGPTRDGGGLRGVPQRAGVRYLRGSRGVDSGGGAVGGGSVALEKW